MRVNGLFGWVEYNNTRSIALLLGFILLMQPLAAITLFVPLLYADPTHAPSIHSAGYAVRYVPIVTLAAAALVRHADVVASEDCPPGNRIQLR